MTGLRIALMCVFVSTLADAAPPGTGAKRPFALSHLYDIKDVSDPRFSPDGKQVVFTVREDRLKDGGSDSDIYRVNADGSNLTRLTNSPGSDTAPRWSPDGSGILFISSRSGKAQAWLVPASGGEPLQITRFPSGVSDPVWLPDGKRFLFTSKVFPECGADTSCNERHQAGLDRGPIKAYMSDRLLYRHWNELGEGKRSHIFLCTIATGTVVDLTPGDFDSPAFSTGGGGYAVSPDGSELCFVSNRDEREAETTNKDLWIVSTSGGTPVNITDDNEAYDGDPSYSPDGRYIAYRMQVIPRFEADRFRLAVYDRVSRESIVLSESFDNWVNSITWAPDSRRIYFTADVQGHVPLYSVEISTKSIRRVIDVKTIDAISITPDGTSLALIRRSVAEPRELWTVGTSGTSLRRITFFNRALEDSVDLRPVTEMWIPSPSGKNIHTFIVTPHNFDPSHRYPLILNVHGGPQSQWEDAFRGDWQVYPGSGYVVAFPNPHGSTGYGQAFTDAISKDWGGKVYDDVTAVADSLSKLPWVDGDRMGAMGWSYGGYMMMWLEGHSKQFKALAAMMGVYNLKAFHGTTEELWFPEWDFGGAPWQSDLYDRWSPNASVLAFSTPCLVLTGEKDFRVSYTQSLEFFTDLQRMGVPSRLIVFKNDGHWPAHAASMPLYYNAHLEWFHRYLGGAPAPYDTQQLLRNLLFDR